MYDILIITIYMHSKVRNRMWCDKLQHRFLDRGTKLASLIKIIAVLYTFIYKPPQLLLNW